MEFLNEYLISVILGICLVVGYIIKQWIKDIDNKYIPTVVTVLGIILSIWMNNWIVTPDILLQGAISGLASTGLHQLFKQYIEIKNNKE